jgi:hypothetical protein
MRPRKLTRTWVFAVLGAVLNAPCCWAVSAIASDEPGIALVVAFFLMLIGAIAGAFLGTSLGQMLSKGSEEWPQTEEAGRRGSKSPNFSLDPDPHAFQQEPPKVKETNAIQEERKCDAP